MSLDRGVHGVLATPFAADESLDEPSIGTLVDHYVAAGVSGVLALGVLGEADRLSDAERDRVLAGVLDGAAGRVQVTAGVTHASTRVTAERAAAAERAGADAVMVSPPSGGPAAREHLLRVREAVSIPVVVQDHPASSGVSLPVELLAGLGDVAVKLEAPPTPAKIAALREAAPELAIFGGLGGVSLLQELDAGSDGTMTGFAFPEVLVEIVEAHRSGDRERARAVYERALPLIVLEAHPGAGVALRKEILRRRGAITAATVRSPSPPLDRHALDELDELWERAAALAAPA